MIFQSGLDYLIKLVAFVALYIAIHTASNYIYDERLYYVLPMSIYLATKVCNQSPDKQVKSITWYSYQRLDDKIMFAIFCNAIR